MGETLACGTGACAVAAAAHGRGEVGTRVRVHNPGGPLDVELEESGVLLAGPTQKVGDVVVDEAWLAAWADASGEERAAAQRDTPDVVATEVATRQ